MSASRIRIHPDLRPLRQIHRAQIARQLQGKVLDDETADVIARSRALLRAQTEQIAGRLEAAGIQARRPADDIVLFGLATHDVRQAEDRWRPLMLLPEVQALQRSKDRLALVCFLQLHPKGKFARYGVATSGVRCSIPEAEERLDRFLKHLARWVRVARRNDIEVVLRAIELTVDRDMTVHIHANLVYIPHRRLGGDGWSEFHASAQAALGNAIWRDCGIIKDVNEVLKYTLKYGVADSGSPEEQSGALVKTVSALTKTHVADPTQHPFVLLHHLLFRRHLVQPYGLFRDFMRQVREQRLKLWRDPDSRTVKAIQRPRPTPPPPNPSGTMLENWVIAETTPWAMDGRRLEPVAIVLGYTENPVTWQGKRALERLRSRYAALLREDEPSSGAAPSSVHTSRLSLPAAGSPPPPKPPPPPSPPPAVTAASP